MTAPQAHTVYSLLMLLGAPPVMEQDFVDAQTHGCCPEWRFSGALGFGGKFRVAHNRWWVDCYREDETEERRRMMVAANDVLHELRQASEIEDALNSLWEATK